MQPNQTPIQAFLAQNPYKPAAKQKQTGKGGTLTSLISEGGAVGGGLAGAAAGSVVGPVGTLVGGAIGAGIGAFTGRVAENKVRDNRVGLGDAAKEGLVTGLLSAPGKGLKVGYTASKALAKGGGLEEALMAANAAASKAGVVGGAVGKVQSGAADRYATGMGIKSSGNLRTGKADDVANFVLNLPSQYGKINPSNAKNMARDITAAKDKISEELKTQLAAINRPLSSQERTQIANDIKQAVAQDTGITGSKELTERAIQDVLTGKDIKRIEDIRSTVANQAFNSKGETGAAVKAQEAKHISEAIDKFVTNLPDEMAGKYKEVKGHYHLIEKADKLASVEGGKIPKGVNTSILSVGGSNGVGGNFISAARNKINAAGANIGKGEASINPGRTGAFMGGKGQLADALLNAQGSMNADMTDSTMPPNTIQNNTSNIDAPYQNEQDLSTPESQNPYPRENLMYDVQRDPQHAEDYIKLFQQYQDIFPEQSTTEKPLSAESSKVVSNANIGLQALDDFQAALGQDPNLLAKRVIPGRALLGGAVGGALGTNGADAAAQQIVDVIARLRTGAAITNDEARQFQKFIPQAGDNPQVQAQKLSYLRNQFQAVANRTGGGSNSLEDALMQQQGGYQ